jgi:hypothetical protein
MARDYEAEAKATLKKRFIIFLVISGACGFFGLILLIVGIASGTPLLGHSEILSSTDSAGYVSTSTVDTGETIIGMSTGFAVMLFVASVVFAIICVKNTPSDAHARRRAEEVAKNETAEKKKLQDEAIAQGKGINDLTLDATIVKEFLTRPSATVFGLDEKAGTVQFSGPLSSQPDEHGVLKAVHGLSPIIPVEKLRIAPFIRRDR